MKTSHPDVIIYVQFHILIAILSITQRSAHIFRLRKKKIHQHPQNPIRKVKPFKNLLPVGINAIKSFPLFS